MPDDPKFFDDDNLIPDWLRGMGGGETEPEEEPPSAPPRQGAAAPPWETQSGAQPPAPPGSAATAAPWEAHQGAPAPQAGAPSVTPPWGGAPSADQPPEFDWSFLDQSQGPELTEAPPSPAQGEIPPGLTGELPWMAEPSGAAEEAPFTGSETGLTDELSWLTGQPEAPSAAQQAGLSDQRFTMDDLLSEFDDEAPAEPPPAAAPSLRDRLHAQASPDALPPADENDLDWLMDTGASETPSETPRTALRRIRPADEPPEQPLSYDEWEQQQIEQAREAQRTPEDRLLDEVPDWFDQVEAAPEEGQAQPGGPEFVPDWFLGLEQQKTEEAPDWFQDMDYSPDALAQPPAPPPERPAPAPMGDDLPDWFKGVGADLPEPDMDALVGQSQPPAAPGDMPDWLAAAAPGSGMMAEPEDIPFPDLDLDQPMPGIMKPEPQAEDFVERFDPLAPDILDAETPDWLREMALDEGMAPVPGVPEAAAPVPGAEEGLDWLTTLSPEDIAAEPAPEPADLQPPATPARSPEEQLFGGALDSRGIDDLLGLYVPSEPEEPEMPEEALVEEWSPPEEEAAPALEPESDYAALFAEAEPVESTPRVEDIFPSFEEAESAFQPTEPLAEPAVEEEPPAAPTPQPEWVSELRPSDLPVTVKAGGAEASIAQKQVTELPEPLRHIREEALREIEGVGQAPAPQSGPLAGIAGALPLSEVILAQATAVAPVKGVVVTPQQQARAQRLQALLELTAAEEEAGALPGESLPPGFLGEAATLGPVVIKRARRQARLKLDRVLISLLLFAGLLLPFASDAVHFAADPAPLAGDRLAAAGAVDQLVPGDQVLFAFEYGPTAAGELDPLAEAVLRDVLARGGVPLTISTNPAGALHARAVIAPLNEDERLLAARGESEAALEAGTDYVLLGYLPGEMIGVRSLRNPTDGDKVHPAFDSDLRGDDTLLTVDDVEEDIALVVVIGEGSEDVRTWAEQLEGVDVPKIALVTAAAEPAVDPYLYEDGYAGYLAGVRDTYAYNAERNANNRAPYTLPENLDFELPDPEVARWHSMALGAAAAAGLIGLGLVLNLFRGLLRRSRR
jgi:hypothetical protein